jgi:hypothetical protein
MPKKPGKPKRDDLFHEKLRARAAPALAVVRDIRRAIITPVPTGEVRTAVKGLTGSLFPSMVRDATDDVLLKGGENIAKIGGAVLVGSLKGARIVSLALEERATCPRSCTLWDTCYTNNMPRLIRYRPGPLLEPKLAVEVAQLCRDHAKVLVRLHISGDFYSLEYVALWGRLLARHPGLHVFGFTAWDSDTTIGAVIAAMRDADPARFAVRTSGRTGKWGSFTLPFPTDRPMIGDAAVCPEQRDAMDGHKRQTHCGSCGLCWKTGGAATGRPIAFIEH